MTGVLSKPSRLSDIRRGYLRPQTSRAHRFNDASDADFRNLVASYRTEAEVIAEAKRSFFVWLNKVDAVSRLSLDAFSLWRAYKEGHLSKAREIGQLPSKSAI